MIIDLPLMGEKIHAFRHKSGMRVYWIPKDFHSNYAILAVNFGSFLERLLKKKDGSVLPYGTAHFLEHKMFENADGIDTFESFAKVGASANAYTAFDRTCYLFSTSENTGEALRILISSVYSPYFTSKNIKKEIGIISQEIDMYKDDPLDALYYLLLGNMYESSPIKNDICGSASSIKKITKEDLYLVHSQFYTPDQSVLVLCGSSFNEQEIQKILDDTVSTSNLSSKEQATVSLPEKESSRVYRKSSRLFRDVSMPLVGIGIKDTDIGKTAVERQKKFTLMNILLGSMFTGSGDFVSSLVLDGLIPDEPYYEILHNASLSHILFFTRTHEPDRLIRRMYAYFQKTREKGIPYEDFIRSKKVAYASMMSTYNSSEELANEILSDALEEDSFSTMGEQTANAPRILLKATYEEVQDLAHTLFREESITKGIIYPKYKGEL